MLFHHVAIQALAIVEAPHRITSESMRERVGDQADRIGWRPGVLTTLTGVEARRFWDPGASLSQAAAQAGSLAIAQAGIEPGQIGLLLNTSVCREYLEPSMASLVHGILELAPECLNFDVCNACLAFLNGMCIAANMIERGQIEYALIVDAESSREITEATLTRLARPDSTSQDLRDDFATLTLGSGAAAMVLCRAELATTTHRFRGGPSISATQWNHLCRGTEERMITDAGQLLKAGVELAKQTFAQAMGQLGWRPDDLDELILHQVGSIHMSTLLDALELPVSHAFVTYKEYGNIGPAAIPFTLTKSAQAGRLYPGDRVALMGIGSGLNCAMMEVLW